MPKVLRTKERAPTPYSLVVFTLDSHFNLLRSLGACQLPNLPRSSGWPRPPTLPSSNGRPSYLV